MIEKAEAFAREKHKGQYRKYPENTEYITHPKAVVEILKSIKINDEIVLSAAWLHDIVEDCGVSLNEVREEFNDDIADLVGILTHGEDKEEYVMRFLNTDKRAQLIKLADVTHNSRNYKQGLDEKSAKRFEYFCEIYYLPLAKKICPALYCEISNNLANESFKNLI